MYIPKIFPSLRFNSSNQRSVISTLNNKNNQKKIYSNHWQGGHQQQHGLRGFATCSLLAVASIERF